ncbi:carboxylesterase [Filomicrobium insigne]|uniref:Carboxylesterase n=1 Tax=Filomicrobium insigne TaxID=418854 RepID=A0A1H0T957_9HYPH|nr:alpha/beta fold hydrolase [Filomicrobium insigne]SDP50539.1 carboxylesterase [Filomicrobium insigne]
MIVQQDTYKIKGGRIGVLLVHGLCGSPTEMRYVANGMARQGYTVHCPRLAGHGGSVEDLKATSWQDWYKSVEDALFELSQNCDRVFVGGLSTGAVLGLLLAARHPDKVHGLTLFSPTLWVNGWLIPWYMRLFKLVRSKRIANLIKFPDLHPHGIKDDRIRQFVVRALVDGETGTSGLRNTPGCAVLEHRRLVSAVKREVRKIQQPALILHPREDDYAHLNNAWYLQSKLAGPVEVTVLEDSYHIVTVDRQRDVVVERSTVFIARLVGDAAEERESTVTRFKVSVAA